MRFLSLQTLSRAKRSVRLAILIAAVQQGANSPDILADHLGVGSWTGTGGLGHAAAKKAKKEVPFRGSIEGFETSVVEFPSVFVDGSASGNATHLGRFTMTYELEVDIATPPPFDTIGSSVFTAANGDCLFSDIVGLGTPTADPNVLSVREEHTITGGTNRFAGATGSFIRTYSLFRDTGATSGSFEGTIVKR
jgi:hypothetical protein